MKRAGSVCPLVLAVLFPLFITQCVNEPFRIDNGRVLSFDAGDADNGEWEAIHSISNLRVEDGSLKGDITGPDPHFHGPPGLRTLAELNSGVELRMKIDAGTHAQFYWTTSSDPAWGGSKVRQFAIVADNQWHTYTLNFQRSRDWMGFISRFRIDPNTSAGGHFEIDSIRFIGASLTTNNIQYYGYYHVEDNRFGRHMHDVAGYTNFVHLTWSAGALDDFRGTVIEAGNLGLKVIPELSNVFLFHQESQWPARLDAFANDVAGLEDILLCIYLIDEPYQANPIVDNAKQERAVALTQQYFPDLPHMINYSGDAGLNTPAANLDWIAYDAYHFDNVTQYSRFYTGFEKPAFMIGKSYSSGSPEPLEELELLTLGRFTYDQIRKFDEVVSLWWFMYGNVENQNMRGAKSYPDLLEYQQDIAADLFGW